MKSDERNSYVYVYIDPRNLREFYVGKGTHNRKDAHLNLVEEGRTPMAETIRAIRDEGLNPIIRVVARDLTEDEAFLVEKTLIWRAEGKLKNISGGHYAHNFRPPMTLHREILGFDFHNAAFTINMTNGPHRTWEDAARFGFVSAGQDWKKWGSKLERLKPGDLIIPYINGHGYTAVGRVIESAVPVDHFRFQGHPLSASQLKAPHMLDSKIGTPDCEHLVKVEWIKTLPLSSALRRSAQIPHFRGVITQFPDEALLQKILDHFGLSAHTLLDPVKLPAAS